MEPLTHAWNAHFDGVCQAELQRLRKKKTASLAERAEVEAIAAQVVRAIAATTVTAWTLEGANGADPVVRRLFGLSEGLDRTGPGLV